MSDCKVIKVNFNENELAKMVNCKVDKEVVRATEAEQEITNSLNESVSDLNESIRETNESISNLREVVESNELVKPYIENTPLLFQVRDTLESIKEEDGIDIIYYVRDENKFYKWAFMSPGHYILREYPVGNDVINVDTITSWDDVIGFDPNNALVRPPTGYIPNLLIKQGQTHVVESLQLPAVLRIGLDDINESNCVIILSSDGKTLRIIGTKNYLFTVNSSGALKSISGGLVGVDKYIKHDDVDTLSISNTKVGEDSYLDISSSYIKLNSYSTDGLSWSDLSMGYDNGINFHTTQNTSMGSNYGIQLNVYNGEHAHSISLGGGGDNVDISSEGDVHVASNLDIMINGQTGVVLSTLSDDIELHSGRGVVLSGGRVLLFAHEVEIPKGTYININDVHDYVATENYVDEAIANAITSALEGDY